MARNNGPPTSRALNTEGGDFIVSGSSSTGNLGVGVATPTTRVDVAGGVRATGTGDLGTLFVQNDARVYGNLVVDETTTLSGTLNVHGTTNMIGNVRVESQPPIVFRQVFMPTDGDTTTSTDFNVSDYDVFIGGMIGDHGDFNEVGGGELLNIHTYRNSDGKWWVKANIRTEPEDHEDWIAGVAAVSKKLTEIDSCW